MFFIDLLRKICCCFGSSSLSSEQEPILGEGPYFLDNNCSPILYDGNEGFSSPVAPVNDSYTYSVNAFSASVNSVEESQSVAVDESERCTPTGSPASSDSDHEFGFGTRTPRKSYKASNSATSSPGSIASGFSSLGFNTPEKNGSQTTGSVTASPMSFKSDFSLGRTPHDDADISSLNFSDDEQQLTPSL